MNRSALTKDGAAAAILSVSLERQATIPLHAQLAQALRDLILTGRIASGARLPASRQLASELGVSRITVTSAIEQLISEGYAEGRPGSGVYVAADLPEQLLQAKPQLGAERSTGRPSAPALRQAVPAPRPQPVQPFRSSQPDMREFPHRQWARLLERAWRNPEKALLADPDPCGWYPLRQAIAAHLHAWRGLDCLPEDIIITSGVTETMSLIAYGLWPSGSEIMLEEPGFPPIRHALTAARMQCRALPVDEQGFDPASIPSVKSLRGIVITPSRQFPLGMTMPVGRRLELLQWAKQYSGVIIEDDFDSEFRYQGRPLPAMMSLDDDQSVIYVGSFSKVFSSLVRLGYLVAPPRLRGPIISALERVRPHAALISQPALAQFMQDGAFAAHIRRMRRLYGRRQQALLALAEHYWQDLLALEASPAGMHLLARLLPQRGRSLRLQTIVERAAAANITLQNLADFYAGQASGRDVHRPGLLLGFAGFDEQQLEHAVTGLAHCLRADQAEEEM